MVFVTCVLVVFGFGVWYFSRVGACVGMLEYMSDVEFSEVEFLYGVYQSLLQQTDEARENFFTALESLVNSGASVNELSKKLGDNTGSLAVTLRRRKAKRK